MKSKEFWIYDNPEWNNPTCYRGEPTWSEEPDETGRVVHVIEASVVQELIDTLKSVAQRVHQAYHEGEPADCRKGVCLDIRGVITKAEPREAQDV